MAEARKETKQIPRTVIYDKVEVVTIELTQEEAMFLSALTSKVSGCPIESMRKHSDSIRDALIPVVGERFFNRNAYFDNAFNWERAGVSMRQHADVYSNTYDVRDPKNRDKNPS